MKWRLLSGLDEEEQREFVALGRRRSFGRNQVLCHAGDPADSLHLVSTGRLAVHVSLPSGDVAMINVLMPGSYFGELALFREDGYRTATITALEPSETLAISASAFHELRRRRPEVERTVTAVLADRIDELSQLLLEARYVGLDRRVYRRLVDLARGGDTEFDAVVPLTQSQLADLTGGARASVNQVLQKLVGQGIVSVARGRVVIHDVARLESKIGH